MEKMKAESIYLLCQDASIKMDMRRVCEDSNLFLKSFAHQKDFLQALQARVPVLIFMAHKSMVSASSFFSKIKTIAPLLPVWCLIPAGNVKLAVLYMKLGAREVFETPLNTLAMTLKVKRHCQKLRLRDSCYGSLLTEVQKNILSMVLQGLTNRQIAHSLGRSLRTIEDHKHVIMKKIGTKGTVELINKARQLDWDAGADEVTG